MDARITKVNHISKLVEDLRQKFKLNSFQFSMDCAQALGGDEKKSLRQEVMEYLTSRQWPARQCTTTRVEVELSNHFTQYSMF